MHTSELDSKIKKEEFQEEIEKIFEDAVSFESSEKAEDYFKEHTIPYVAHEDLTLADSFMLENIVENMLNKLITLYQ